MITRPLFLIVFGFLLLFSEESYGQAATVQLYNPSFEDYPRAERVPRGWKDCGFPGESAPDTHPSGAFEVVKAPSDGNTYLGMVVRDNDTWERVAQPLLTPIEAGQCYSFMVNLCRSELYVSRSRVSNVQSNYVKPIKLVIWGGDSYCSKKERLAESPLVTNTTWQAYSFKFEPKQTHTYIVLEAFYKTPVLFPYNGNILVDKASDIVPMPCDEEPIIAKIPEVNFTMPGEHSLTISNQAQTLKAVVKNVSKKSDISLKINGKENYDFAYNKRTGMVSAPINNFKAGRNTVIIQATNNAGTTEDRAIIVYQPKEAVIADNAQPKTPEAYEPPIPPKNSAPVVVAPPPAKKNKKIEGYSRAEIKQGQVIKLSALSFKMNDSTLTTSANLRLEEIYEFLQENKEVIVEIGGHTSGLCEEDFCNQLSTARAKAVADYLRSRGISRKQISYKGYGKNKPIASNNTPGGRRKNQRVEIKILSTDG